MNASTNTIRSGQDAETTKPGLYAVNQTAIVKTAHVICPATFQSGLQTEADGTAVGAGIVMKITFIAEAASKQPTPKTNIPAFAAFVPLGHLNPEYSFNN